MRKICFISFFCLSYVVSSAQTTSPDSPKLTPDTSSSIDQNKSGALYRSPNDSLKRPISTTVHQDSVFYSKSQIKDSLVKESTHRKAKGHNQVKYSTNRKGEKSTRQNARNQKKQTNQ